MFTVIAFDHSGLPQIRRYDTENPAEARNRFVDEWIAGGIAWDGPDMAGPNCTAEHPGFPPEYLRRHGYDNQPDPMEHGVLLFSWWWPPPDFPQLELPVVAYFVPSK